MANAPLGWMYKQEILKVLYRSIFFSSLVYINDLLDNLTSNPKLFTDNTPLFSTVTDPNAATNQINNDFHNNTWEMNFKADTSKQAQEVIFSRKIKVTAHPQLVFNNNPVHETSARKHVGMFLNFKLNFQQHFENMLNEVNKTIGLLRKLENTLPVPSLLTIYNSFIRPYLDYGKIIYVQAYIFMFTCSMFMCLLNKK